MNSSSLDLEMTPGGDDPDTVEDAVRSKATLRQMIAVLKASLAQKQETIRVLRAEASTKGARLSQIQRLNFQIVGERDRAIKAQRDISAKYKKAVEENVKLAELADRASQELEKYKSRNNVLRRQSGLRQKRLRSQLQEQRRKEEQIKLVEQQTSQLNQWLEQRRERSVDQLREQLHHARTQLRQKDVQLSEKEGLISELQGLLREFKRK